MRNGICTGMAALAVSAWTALAAGAQQPSQYGGISPQFQSTPYGSSYGQFSPYGLNDYYNPSSQPLSPYLNMLRGGNPAVNYYYGVRPAQNQNAYGAPFVGANGMGGRQTFFPQVDTLSTELEEQGRPAGMRPTGHPFAFNNTLGYFGQTGGGVNKSSNAAGPLATKFSGSGTSSAPSTTPSTPH